MIRNTFCHVPGVGARTERQLWSLGFHSWESLNETSGAPVPFGKRKTASLREHIAQSFLALQEQNAPFFAERLPSQEHWRLFAAFRDSVAYLDIETAGTGDWRDHITAIALYDGRSIRTYVHGRNMRRFAEDVQRYKLLVTYNGKCFDLPFIRNTLRVRMDQAHIDLRYVLKSLGYAGGLKGCEKRLGIDRKELDGVDGYFAVLLWEEFCRTGSEKALETLLAYNVLDAVNLERLMVTAYNLKLASTPFGKTHELAEPLIPSLPFMVDEALLLRIRRRVFGVA